LAISNGAGAGGQNAIGRAVVGGMLSATVLAIFFVPMFFIVVMRLFGHSRDAEPVVEDRPHDNDRHDDGERGTSPAPQGA
jgi:multidrug efflux pump